MGKFWNHSEETRKRISESKKGEKNPMFAKIFTSEHRKKLSDAQKRRNFHLSPEHKTKLINSRPAHWSDETKRKISISSKGRPAWNKGMSGLYPISNETKLKISKANKGKIKTAEWRKHLGDAHRGKKLPPHSSEWNRKISEGNKGKIMSEESIQKYKKFRVTQVIPFRDSSIEIKLQDELSSRGYGYYKHYPVIGQPDIAIIHPNKKIAVFCDGDFFHGNPEKYKPDDLQLAGKTMKEIWEKDTKINEELRKQGFLVLRYWEHEINVNTEAVVDEIEDCFWRR